MFNFKKDKGDVVMKEKIEKEKIHYAMFDEIYYSRSDDCSYNVNDKIIYKEFDESIKETTGNIINTVVLYRYKVIHNYSFGGSDLYCYLIQEIN